MLTVLLWGNGGKAGAKLVKARAACPLQIAALAISTNQEDSQNSLAFCCFSCVVILFFAFGSSSSVFFCLFGFG